MGKTKEKAALQGQNKRRDKVTIKGKGSAAPEIRTKAAGILRSATEKPEHVLTAME